MSEEDSDRQHQNILGRRNSVIEDSTCLWKLTQPRVTAAQNKCCGSEGRKAKSHCIKNQLSCAKTGHGEVIPGEEMEKMDCRDRTGSQKHLMRGVK